MDRSSNREHRDNQDRRASGKRGPDILEWKWQFEAKSKKDLAWHDVGTWVNFKYSGTRELEVLVRYAGYDKVDEEWVNVKNEMRERSIPLEPSQCHKVKDGDLAVCLQERDHYALYFDARVVRIQRRQHDATDCKCIFTVRFLHDNSEEEIDWKKVYYRPTQEESVVDHNTPEPTKEPKRPKQEESVGCHSSPEPTKEPSLSDIENLWP
ncbi:protein SAWADEE HOMEODOMAIN HOMOLOG 1-like [Lotus japonicus]|uniref:SAWADEE domain-containing protein n=1 Tax=Lotus japonicus TaxID=34305 RepID=I3SAF7_LOTJA|nr:protein SAWADEE HOMEODOMAIN HOMOLOG 1-like [Lotus japonicus]AFK37249.1 unknown [Lotus japonicus]